MNPSAWCLYHRNCIDGLAAAAVVQRAHPQASFHPWTYGQHLPDLPLAKQCYILDVVPPREWLQQVASANQLTWIDHHRTALAIRDELGIGIIDIEECAATLTWKTLFPEQKIPPILLHIRDKDLWQWRHPDSRSICAAISQQLNHDTIADLFSWDLAELHQQGQPIIAAELAACKTIAQRGLVCHDPYGRLNIRALAINSGERISEVGELVYRPSCDGGLGYDLSIHFWMRADGKWIHSLRSVTVDCRTIAEARGGGGHQNAAAYISDVPFPLSEDYLG